VAIDKDGTEKISNGMMLRRYYITSILYGIINVHYSKNKSKKWANSWSTDESDPMPFSGVTLPKGSILKLIGKTLTWNDEPVEIKSN